MCTRDARETRSQTRPIICPVSKAAHDEGGAEQSQSSIHDATSPATHSHLSPFCASSFSLGYTGYVRGSQHMSGRTFGETTRRALSSDYREIVCTSPIPSSPQANRKIRHEALQDTFVANMFGGKKYQIPGHTPTTTWRAANCCNRSQQQQLAHSTPFFLSLSPMCPQATRALCPACAARMQSVMALRRSRRC